MFKVPVPTLPSVSPPVEKPVPAHEFVFVDSHRSTVDCPSLMSASSAESDAVGVATHLLLLVFHVLPETHVPVTVTESKTEFEFLASKVVPLCATVAGTVVPDGEVDMVPPV